MDSSKVEICLKKNTHSEDKHSVTFVTKVGTITNFEKKNRVWIKLTSFPKIDQINILRPSISFALNLLSAACKMLNSDWL